MGGGVEDTIEARPRRLRVLLARRVVWSTEWDSMTSKADSLAYERRRMQRE